MWGGSLCCNTCRHKEQAVAIMVSTLGVFRQLNTPANYRRAQTTAFVAEVVPGRFRRFYEFYVV